MTVCTGTKGEAQGTHAMTGTKGEAVLGMCALCFTFLRVLRWIDPCVLRWTMIIFPLFHLHGLITGEAQCALRFVFQD
jgi:hypothetical protein